MTTPYTPPTDSLLELEALQLTADISRKEGITNQDDLRRIQNAVLRLLASRRGSPQAVALADIQRIQEAEANG